MTDFTAFSPVLYVPERIVKDNPLTFRYDQGHWPGGESINGTKVGSAGLGQPRREE